MKNIILTLVLFLSCSSLKAQNFYYETNVAPSFWIPYQEVVARPIQVVRIVEMKQFIEYRPVINVIWVPVSYRYEWVPVSIIQQKDRCCLNGWVPYKY